jgi:predicted O-methyltransferase YrrM
VVRREPLLLVLTSPRPLKGLEAERLRIAADGKPLDVQVHTQTSPNVISSVLPAAPDKGHGESTELVLGLAPSEENRSERTGPDRVAIDRVCLVRPVGGRAADFPLSHFDGKHYLHRFPDVAIAVSEGKQPSALAHYQRFGQKEGRPLPLALGLGAQPSAGTALDLALADVSSRFRTELAATTKASDDRFDQRIKALEGGIAGRAEALNDRLESLGSQLAAGLDELREAQAAHATNTEQRLIGAATQLDERIKTLEESVTGRTEALNDRLESLGSQLAARLDGLVASAPVFNFGDFQSFNRKLTKDHIKVIQDEWTRKLSLKKTPRALSYVAHRIATLESSSHGRLATTIEDAVLRTLVAASAKGDTLNVLEIGTLFGIGLAMIYDHARPNFKSVHLTAIDPLEGYYDKKVEDVTGQSVDEATFRRNLANAGVPETDYTLIQAFSTDDAAIKAASRSSYDVLIIDGDHSYAGVKVDFVLYAPFVKRGGYIIFDDYGAADWPDVKKFVDESVHGHPDVGFVGASWRTAVFRVVQPLAGQADGPRTLAEGASKRRRAKVTHAAVGGKTPPRPTRRRSG